MNKSDNKSNKKVDNYDKTLEQIKKEMKENTWERVFDESNDWILLDNNLNANNGEHRIKLKLRREKPMILVTAIIPFEDVKNNKVNIKLNDTKFNEYGNMFFGDKLDFTELDKSLKTRLKEVVNKNNEIFETDRGKVGNYNSSISYVGSDNLLALEISIEN